jgi:hypothetical protein
MKRFGSITLLLAGFIAGLVFVYSCSLNGDEVEAQPRSPLDIQSYQFDLNSTSPNDELDDPFGATESFIVTDITVSSASVADIRLLKSSPNAELRFRFLKGAGSGIPLTESVHFNSGIVFNPGETLRVEGLQLSSTITSVNISGYLATN